MIYLDEQKKEISGLCGHHNKPSPDNTFCVGLGLRPPFTEAPDNPTYVTAGSDARLKWNFLYLGGFRRVEIHYENTGWFVTLVWKYKEGKVVKNTNLPKSLTSRITIEGNATLVISKVNTEDTTRYQCEYFPLSGTTTTEIAVQLIVTGEPF